ncbi:MAG TPA: hypothetical protein VIK72_19435 [Clostridiaceae bacterium]
MTVYDLLKRIEKEDYHKVIVFNDGKGWTNVKLVNTISEITLVAGNNTIFSDGE